MSVRALAVLLLFALPSTAATFGTVMAHPQPIADLAIDPTPSRPRLYVLNTPAKLVEVYDITNRTAPSLRTRISTGDTPLALAVSPSGTNLYIVNYGSSTLQIVDLAALTSRTVTLPASPQAVAVGFNEQVLISTIGTGTGASVLLTFNPTTGVLGSIAVGPPAPAAPTTTAANLIWAQAARAKLQASADGRTIVGAHMLANNSRTVFVYDVNSATVLRSRNVGGISSVLAVSPNGGQFLSGPLLFESSTMLIMGQQNVANSPYVMQPNPNFNTQAIQGGAVWAQTTLGQTVVAGYNIVPTLVPAARTNTSQIVFNTTDNLLIQLGIQIVEQQSGRMVITPDNSTIYAVSQSGFLVLPIGSLSNSPMAMPDSNVALLAFDQCGLTASQSSATIPVRNIGGRTITVTSQILATSATAATTRVTSRPYGGDVTASFSTAASRTIGTANPDQLLIQSNEAINIVPNVRVFQNNRNTETRGTILPVDTGATTAGLTDLVSDPARQRLYIANPGLNRVEVFDMRSQQFQAPIRVGQLPRSLAIDGDGNTLYVANAGSETITVIDLNKGTVTGRINYPPIPFNASFAQLTPQVLSATRGGVQVVMSDGTLWKVVGTAVQPRTLNPTVFGTARALAGPQTMASSPDGSYALLLVGNGTAYLYDSTVDDFVTGRTVVGNPITGYYGPIAAGPNGGFYIVNDQLLNSALTSQGSTGTGPVGGGGLPTPGGPTTTGRPVAALAAVNAQTYARFSTPVRASAAAAVTDAGMVEVIDFASGRTTATAQVLEGPLAVAAGTARVNINGRTMAVDSGGQNAYVLTASGLSIVPLTAVSNQNAPALTGSAVVNTANFTAGVAPGGLISILGRNLGTAATASTTPLPTVLGGACVTLNNTPIPLLATSAGQINAQIPPTLAAGRYPLIVRSIANQAASGTVTVTVAVARYAPAIFVDSQGPAIYHKDGRRVTKSNPAKRDEPLTLYATGLGTTTGGRVTAGQPAPSSPLAVTAPVNLYFGDPTWKQAAIIVDWSGLQPGSIGVYQINARVPGFHISGDALPVTLRIGGVGNVTTGSSAATVSVE